MSFLKEVDNTWTLFLDRDGVINHEIKGDYIRNLSQLELYNDAADAIKLLTDKFYKIIVVTNQRGIGKGLMTENDLKEIHESIKNKIVAKGGMIDAFYFAPDIDSNATNRKPNTGMALMAKKDFVEINFSKSIMIGNNISDMEFGKNMGMKTIFLRTTNQNQQKDKCIDLFFDSLFEFAQKINSF